MNRQFHIGQYGSVEDIKSHMKRSNYTSDQLKKEIEYEEQNQNRATVLRLLQSALVKAYKSEADKNLPPQVAKWIGRKVNGSGNLFSNNKKLPERQYTVLEAKMSDAIIVDNKTGKKSKCFKLLLYSQGMLKPQWSKPFPIK